MLELAFKETQIEPKTELKFNLLHEALKANTTKLDVQYSTIYIYYLQNTK